MSVFDALKSVKLHFQLVMVVVVLMLDFYDTITWALVISY